MSNETTILKRQHHESSTVYSNGTLTLKREFGTLPPDDNIDGYWVLRDNGVLMDHHTDQEVVLAQQNVVLEE